MHSEFMQIAFWSHLSLQIFEVLTHFLPDPVYPSLQVHFGDIGLPVLLSVLSSQMAFLEHGFRAGFLQRPPEAVLLQFQPTTFRLSIANRKSSKLIYSCKLPIGAQE
jgi:hypothetical protein